MDTFFALSLKTHSVCPSLCLSKLGILIVTLRDRESIFTPKLVGAASCVTETKGVKLLFNKDIWLRINNSRKPVLRCLYGMVEFSFDVKVCFRSVNIFNSSKTAF